MQKKVRAVVDRDFLVLCLPTRHACLTIFKPRSISSLLFSPTFLLFHATMKISGLLWDHIHGL